MRTITVTPSAEGWDLAGENYRPLRVERDGDDVILYHPETDRRSAWRTRSTDDVREDVEVLLRVRLGGNMPDAVEWID
jgi:hypothetical protein